MKFTALMKYDTTLIDTITAEAENKEQAKKKIEQGHFKLIRSEIDDNYQHYEVEIL